MSAMKPHTRLPRYSWLLVCIAGMLLSAMLFRYLQGIEQHSIDIWTLAAGLIITALLTLLTFNHVRTNEVLNRKVAQRTRQLSVERAKLAAVIDHAHDAILVVNAKGRILRSNPAANAMFDYSDLARDGLTVHDLVPADIREQHKQWFVLEGRGVTHRMIGQVRELRGQKSSGEAFPCETAVHTFTAGRERQFSVVLRDLTAFKQSQWVQKALLRLRVISQAHSPLHERLKEMLEVMLTSPWPIVADAIYTVQGDQMWLTASQGWKGDEKKRHLMIPVGHCLCGEPIREQHMPCKPVAPDHDAPGSLALSVLHEEHQLGLLYLQMAEGNMLPEAFSSFVRQAHEIVAVTLVRQRIRQTLEDSESKYRQLIETTPVGIIIQTAGVVQFANPAALSMLGANVADSVLKHEMSPRIHTEDRNSFSELIKVLQQGGHIEPTELRLQRLDGSLFWAEIRGVPVVYESNPSVQLLIQDISDRRQAEDQLTLLSYTDELTKLPNRRLYIDRLEQACSMAARRGRQLGLLFLDLDRFKIINDTQGHACGDRVLKVVADRILETLRASDTAARMGGDEFAVLLPETDPSSALRVANKLSRALKQPMLISNQEFSIGVSIGLAAYPDDGRESDTLLNHADSAMYYAKQHRLDVHCFSGEMEEAARRRMVLESELAHAAERQQLQLYYQTQFRLNDDGEQVSGVESLLRWFHPELGMVSPAEFIPIAEEAGLIRPLTAWVIGEASRQARLWHQQGRHPGRIGINVSALELMQVGLAEDILGHIREAGAEPEWFEIEITETAAMSQPDTAIVIMQQLVDGGVSMAIDDFGTGYSSLAYLKRLPAQHLKIDIAFIRNLPDDAEDAVIVRTIIAMAHALGMKVIAEGVETADQLAFLRCEGCDMIQGYLLGKPLPAEQVEEQLPGPDS